MIAAGAVFGVIGLVMFTALMFTALPLTRRDHCSCTLRIDLTDRPQGRREFARHIHTRLCCYPVREAIR